MQISAFSTEDEGHELWRIPLRAKTTWYILKYCILLQLTFCDSGATGLSPSGTLLVVTNLHDGMDWYNLTLQRWVGTSILDLGSKQHIVEPVFIAEDTVASAHANGRMAFAKFNEDLSPEPKVFRALRGKTGEIYAITTSTTTLRLTLIFSLGLQMIVRDFNLL